MSVIGPSRMITSEDLVQKGFPMTTVTTSAPTRPLAARTQRDVGAALAGLAFVVLNVAGTLAAGSPPATDAPAAKVAAFFRDNASVIKAEQLLGALGVVALFWWFGAVV